MTAHQIETLHRLTARAFGQVIDRAHDDESVRARVDLPGDVDKICADNIFRVGQPVAAE